MIARANVSAALMMLDAETFRLVGASLEGYARRMKRAYPRGGLDVLEQRAAEYFHWFRSTNGR
jgi:hypothetical protein